MYLDLYDVSRRNFTQLQLLQGGGLGVNGFEMLPLRSQISYCSCETVATLQIIITMEYSNDRIDSADEGGNKPTAKVSRVAGYLHALPQAQRVKKSLVSIMC